MDYSQNLTIPSVANTPSQRYFCSLFSVSCFDIYYESDGVHTNYIYDKNASSKGSYQINSMLANFIEPKLVPSGRTKLTGYADNCSGPNKNNYVIKFLLTFVDMGVFENVDFKFFVKGHTKNSCDRDFRHNRKYMDTAECWTMAHVIEAVNAAASNAVTGHVPRGSELFKSCKPELTELYKRLDGAQKYQIFSIDSAKPGVVAYKKGPDSDAEEQDLRRKLDGILTAKEKVVRIIIYHIEVLPPPAINPEQKEHMYSGCEKSAPPIPPFPISVQ
ncbi:hypothetical protein PF005_g5427 [Phytophthora fragariae]|uniref:DUF7869 domain-containing protein n=1 Tax=Phytophthora fragariae TaxID=53985 RepID=A0A6A3TC24_9STRA|nr:hypothetical protein PF003_g20942 [Phytophthora fragariae]KAE8948655.1 hypothetical protein PF009_g1782 [Phytophthora fragariae]KAE9022856.1 hypothetical protein PF011_g4250 [Phytophthora fragariae]KAE9127684.1 hypothetical protein PF007_g5515 [Phytophthora fragariae]KAE9128022.1 hypothetical protein PF010_g4652 [Phytophthora fragariae]